MAGYAGRDAVIVSAVRSPIGKGKASGALHDVLPVDLLAHNDCGAEATVEIRCAEGHLVPPDELAVRLRER